jgi:hypothetical protein
MALPGTCLNADYVLGLVFMWPMIQGLLPDQGLTP